MKSSLCYAMGVIQQKVVFWGRQAIHSELWASFWTLNDVLWTLDGVLWPLGGMVGVVFWEMKSTLCYAMGVIAIKGRILGTSGSS